MRCRCQQVQEGHHFNNACLTIALLNEMNASEAIPNKLKAGSLHEQVVVSKTSGKYLLPCLDLQVNPPWTTQNPKGPPGGMILQPWQSSKRASVELVN